MHELQTSPYAAEITAKKFLVRKIFRGSVFRMPPKICSGGLLGCQTNQPPRRATPVGGRAPEVSPDSAQALDFISFSIP
jgi:hypothetical protein